MTRSVFGWSLPPGCTQRHIDEAFGGEAVCECCGHNVDSCICPECPYCGAAGDPACYNAGHESDDVRLRGKMEFTKPQLIGQSRLKIAGWQDQIVFEEQYIAHLESQLAEEELARQRNADKIDDHPSRRGSPDF